MVSSIQRRLRYYEHRLIAIVMVVGLLLVEAVMGRSISSYKSTFVAAAVLSLVGVAAILWRLELGIALLGGLSMYPNPTVFAVQGRRIGVIHVVGGFIVAVWLWRRLVVQRDLRSPRSRLNAPLLALVLTWLVSWIASYTLWNIWVPTDHRQPLFFVAEFGQLLMFIGVFWAVADTVKSELWAKVICAAIVIVNASTQILGGLAWNQLPMALALVCSLLAFEKAGLRLKVGLWAVLGILLWGLLHVNRIPVYLASMAAVFVIGFFKSRRLVMIMLVLFVIIGIVFVKPLWEMEESVSSRIELAGLAWTIFKDYPLLGIGPTHYRSYALVYYPQNLISEQGEIPAMPHNIWLYHLAGIGIIGMLGVTSLLLGILLECLSSLQESREPFSQVLAISVLAGTVGVVIQSVGGHMGFLPDYNLASFYMTPFWVLLGLAAAKRQQLEVA
jgi:hypothetical protein